MTYLGTYGFWTDMDASTVLSRQSMQLSGVEMATFWRRCSLSADIWARYVSFFVPTPAPSGYLPRSAIEQIVAFLLNELFENCAKFSDAPDTSIQYNAWVGHEQLAFQLTNYVTPERHHGFARFIQELLTGDLEDMYIRKIEEQAETNAKGSGLGYLILIKDYGVKFGFRFRQISDMSVAVDVQAHIERQEQ